MDIPNFFDWPSCETCDCCAFCFTEMFDDPELELWSSLEDARKECVQDVYARVIDVELDRTHKFCHICTKDLFEQIKKDQDFIYAKNEKQRNEEDLRERKRMCLENRNIAHSTGQDELSKNNNSMPVHIQKTATSTSSGELSVLKKNLPVAISESLSTNTNDIIQSSNDKIAKDIVSGMALGRKEGTIPLSKNLSNSSTKDDNVVNVNDDIAHKGNNQVKRAHSLTIPDKKTRLRKRKVTTSNKLELLTQELSNITVNESSSSGVKPSIQNNDNLASPVGKMKLRLRKNTFTRGGNPVNREQIKSVIRKSSIRKCKVSGRGNSVNGQSKVKAGCSVVHKVIQNKLSTPIGNRKPRVRRNLPSGGDVSETLTIIGESKPVKPGDTPASSERLNVDNQNNPVEPVKNKKFVITRIKPSGELEELKPLEDQDVINALASKHKENANGLPRQMIYRVIKESDTVITECLTPKETKNLKLNITSNNLTGKTKVKSIKIIEKSKTDTGIKPPLKTYPARKRIMAESEGSSAKPNFASWSSKPVTTSGVTEGTNVVVESSSDSKTNVGSKSEPILDKNTEREKTESSPSVTTSRVCYKPADMNYFLC